MGKHVLDRKYAGLAGQTCGLLLLSTSMEEEREAKP